MELGVVRSAETFELEVMRDQVNEELRRREVGTKYRSVGLDAPMQAQAGHGVNPVSDERPIGSAGLTLDTVEHAFRYHPWDRDQQQAGDEVRDLLIVAAKGIIRRVPPGPSRTRALNCLIDARMLANAGITHRGRF